MEVPTNPVLHVPECRSGRVNRRVRIGVPACLSICCLFGCGPDRPHTIPVRGTVTFGGRSPPAEGAIYFAPLAVADGVPKHAGRSRFDRSGKFTVTSFEDGDGLVPGTYRVRIECWKEAPTMEKPGVSYIPQRYAPPDVVVESSRVTVDVDVPDVAS